MRLLPKRFQFSPKITALCTSLSLVMFWCSSWQWERYNKKVELLRTYDASQVGAAKPLQSVIVGDPNLTSLLHQRTHLSGTYDFARQIIVTNRKHASGPGHWLFTPLKLDGVNKYVIISRGFIPFADRSPETWGKYSFATHDTFDAVVKPSSKQTFLGPRNPAATTEQPFPTLFFHPDIARYAEQLPYPVLTSVFLQRIGKPPSGDFPAQSILVEVPPQTHFGYTIEWALLGIGTLLIGFLLQAFPRKREIRFTQPIDESAQTLIH